MRARPSGSAPVVSVHLFVKPNIPMHIGTRFSDRSQKLFLVHTGIYAFHCHPVLDTKTAQSHIHVHFLQDKVLYKPLSSFDLDVWTVIFSDSRRVPVMYNTNTETTYSVPVSKPVIWYSVLLDSTSTIVAFSLPRGIGKVYIISVHTPTYLLLL